MDFREIVLECARYIEDKKAIKTVVLDLRGKSSIADYFIIAGGENPRHAAALADYAEDKLAELGLKLHHKEGMDGADWVVLDYMDVIVHVFSGEKRDYYRLDALWSDANKIYGD